MKRHEPIEILSRYKRDRRWRSECLTEVMLDAMRAAVCSRERELHKDHDVLPEHMKSLNNYRDVYLSARPWDQG